MPYKFSSVKSGVTVTAKDTGKVYHSASMADAKKAAKMREAFKYMRESGTKPRGK